MTAIDSTRGKVLYTDQRLLATLRRLALGENTISRRDYQARRHDSDPSVQLFERRFGSWGQVVELAGLQATEQPEQLQGQTTKFTAAQILEALSACREETGSVTISSYRHWQTGQPGRPAVATVRFRFGSWSRATGLLEH